MITERELKEAIAKCYQEKNPNANTCMKLASFYSILDHIDTGYSHSSNGQNIVLDSDTDFANIVNVKDVYIVLSIIDELMTTLQVIHPRLYNGVMKKISDS